LISIMIMWVCSEFCIYPWAHGNVSRSFGLILRQTHPCHGQKHDIYGNPFIGHDKSIEMDWSPSPTMDKMNKHWPCFDHLQSWP
jgi:hypothetical protein